MKNLTSAQLADHIHVRYLYKIKTFPMLPDGYCYFQSLCVGKTQIMASPTSQSGGDLWGALIAKPQF